ncbi:seizure protein 6 homolog [Centroberyx affinis]|uniref:seizure protein 6 homolog n=1 Tax=Centroberyx affinis TaxID=166261 RepID=UPI003A5C75CE
MEKSKDDTDLKSELLEKQNKALMKATMAMTDLLAQVEMKDKQIAELTHHSDEIATLKDQVTQLTRYLDQFHQRTWETETELRDVECKYTAEKDSCNKYMNELQQQKEALQEAQGKYEDLLKEHEATQLECATTKGKYEDLLKKHDAAQLELAVTKKENEFILSEKTKRQEILKDTLPATILMNEGHENGAPPHGLSTVETTADRVTSIPVVEGAFSPPQTPRADLEDAYQCHQPPAPLGMYTRDLDKIARNILKFNPVLGGSNDTATYLRQLEYYLRRHSEAQLDDKVYLLKVTSSREVNSFIERQAPEVQANYDLLAQALTREFSNVSDNEPDLITAMTVKQSKNESPHAYYHRLRKAFFGADLTVMSSSVYDQLQTASFSNGRYPDIDHCDFSIRGFTENQTHIDRVMLVELKIGPMVLMHPVYVSEMDTFPLILGMDLLDRFEALIDLKRLKIYAQVREPLPIPNKWFHEDQYDALCMDIPAQKNILDDALLDSAPDETSQAREPWPPAEFFHNQDTLLCSLGPSQSEGQCPLVVNGFDLQSAHVEHVTLSLGTEKSSISLERQVGDKVCDTFRQPVGVSKTFLPHWSDPQKITDKLFPVTNQSKISRGQKDLTFEVVQRNQNELFKNPMGRVMNVNLSEGDKVVFEDLGNGENTMLANESILMRGLVVRSRSNQITIRFHSQRSQAGSVLLRYQAFVLSCIFPQRPVYGDVSVSSLHSGGEAFFFCLTGYQLQGPNTLTCRNASTPYWSGKEPQCLAACGGLMRNITVGRIVSPGFPSNYSNNLTCHWLLEAPEGQRLHIHFEKVALAEDDDRLLIKNGNSIDAAALYDSYEVEYLPNEGLVSTSRHLFIELTTDAAGTSTGIAIRYQAFAAGHCYEPFVKYGNLTSSDSTWAVGAVVEFSCDPGYTLEQGSVTIECMDPNNPQWNETEPACRAVCSGEITDSAGVVLSPNWPEAYDKGQDCIWGIHVEEDKRIMLDIQVLNIGKNDLLTFYDGDDLTALGQYGGSRSRFKLYTSTADVTIQFQSDPATNIYGYGNGFVVHFFEVARNDTCPELPEISNGWKSTSHPELVHGTVVTYQCYPGYQVVGAELLMCQWDLTWSGDLPSCERVVSCADPGKVEHSRRVLTGPRLTVGSTIQYVCNKGFTLSGNSLLTCYNHGSSGPKWNQKLPRCLPEAFAPCSHPGTPTYGIPNSDKLLFQAGETLRYSCLAGHKLLGEPVLHCVPGHPSQWSGLPPVCRAHTMEYDERRLDVATADSRMEGAHVAFAVFVPVTLLLILIFGIYLYFSKVQRKPLRLPLSSTLPYDHIAGESTFDNSVYDTANNEETREYEVSI